MALLRSTSFFAQLSSCCVEMFAFNTFEVATASILHACEMLHDTTTAEAILNTAPTARLRECVEQLRRACTARGLTPEALPPAAPHGPPAATTPPSASGAGPVADGGRPSDALAAAQR